jgi:glucose 1-dehydrogenase
MLVPYKRFGEPDDIAQAAAWLVSDTADYVNGANYSSTKACTY